MALKRELIKESPNINNILKFVDEYEKDNLDTIDKLKRKRKIDIRRINGALRQTIDVHGHITKVLIGSASKRIYGALLTNNKKRNKFSQVIKKILRWI
jgi:hypothetical protein